MSDPNEDDDSYDPSGNEDNDDDKDDDDIAITELCSPSSSKKSAGTLDSIQYDDKVQLYIDSEGKQRWRCLWCKKTFFWNPTKALAHLAKVGKSDIAICKARMDEAHSLTYKGLYESKHKKRDSSSAVKKSLNDSLTDHNNNTATVLDGKRRKTGRGSVSTGISTLSTQATMNTIVSLDPPGSNQKQYVQLKVHDGQNVSLDSKLTMAIADMIHSCGLPFSLSSNLKFRKVLHLSRNVPSTYRPPGRNQVSGELLDINYESYMERNKKKLTEDIEIFGLTFYGDGATVRKMPLINILASGGHLHTAVMEIVDATEQVQNSGKKDARYLASLFRPHIDSFEKKFPNCIDYCTFDGAGSVQKAGHILNARYPRIFVTHGAEHVVSLFFQDCFNLPIVSTLHKIERKAYALFGSGAHHSPYAIFQKYCKIINNGRSIGLFRPAGNRMAGAAIALMRAYRLKAAFLNTLNSHEFTSLKVI